MLTMPNAVHVEHSYAQWDGMTRHMNAKHHIALAIAALLLNLIMMCKGEDNGGELAWSRLPF